MVIKNWLRVSKNLLCLKQIELVEKVRKITTRFTGGNN